MPDKDLYGGSDISYTDDYNIGTFGEFDRFEDERAFAPEMFERPQSTIGGYDELGYTLPASEPDHWFWGYSRPGDVVEQERGIYPLMQRHAPDWMKNMYRGAKGAWGGITDDTITGPGFIDNILEWTNDYISPSQQIAQSQWRRPENIEKTIDVLEIRPEFEGWSRDEIKAYIFRSTQQVNRGGIIGLI